MDYRKLTAEDRALFDKYAASSGNLSWEYNFFTVYAWDISNNRRILERDDVLLLYDIYKGKCIFLPPYLKRKEDFGKAIDLIETTLPCPKNLVWISGLDKDQAAYLKDRGYTVAHTVDESDYLYYADDLKTLRGKAFHSKRNHVNRFLSKYAYTFRAYTEADFDDFLALYDSWETESSHDTLSQERKAIVRALSAVKALDLKIGVILIEGKMCGYSMSSINPDGTVHTAFEKADASYDGIYQALNQFSAQAFFPDGAIVNRQEDMGIEGLRRAKQSYRPFALVDKYKAEKQL